MFKLTVKFNKNNVYVVRLYQRLLWFIWIPEKIEYARRDDQRQVHGLKLKCFRWMEFYENRIIVKNKTDLNLNLQQKV